MEPTVQVGLQVLRELVVHQELMVLQVQVVLRELMVLQEQVERQVPQGLQVQVVPHQRDWLHLTMLYKVIYRQINQFLQMLIL
jgi:hypothetical protein